MSISFGAIQCIVNNPNAPSQKSMRLQNRLNTYLKPMQSAYNNHNFWVMISPVSATETRKAALKVEVRGDQPLASTEAGGLVFTGPFLNQAKAAPAFRDLVHGAIQQWIMKQD